MATRIGDDGPGTPDLDGPGASASDDAAIPVHELPDISYNATDILPVAPPGSRRARREQAEAQDRRSRTAPTPLGRAVVPAAIAVVCAVALAAAWLHLQSDRDAAAAASPSSSPSASPSLAPSTPVPSASATSAVPSASPSASSAPSSSPSTEPTSSPTSSATAAAGSDRSVPVVVLNATGRPGLAARVAASLKADGWTVVSVGNFTPRMAATTIFVVGNADAAATMVGDLGAGDGRVQAPRASMAQGRMTVVVGLDYKA